jgi:hypothetical protein
MADMSPKAAKVGGVASVSARDANQLCEVLNTLGVEPISVVQNGAKLTAFYKATEASVEKAKPAPKAAPVAAEPAAEKSELKTSAKKEK